MLTGETLKGYVRENIETQDRGVTRGAQFPGRRITIGAPNDCGGRQKSQ